MLPLVNCLVAFCARILRLVCPSFSLVPCFRLSLFCGVGSAALPPKGARWKRASFGVNHRLAILPRFARWGRVPRAAASPASARRAPMGVLSPPPLDHEGGAGSA